MEYSEQRRQWNDCLEDIAEAQSKMVQRMESRSGILGFIKKELEKKAHAKLVSASLLAELKENKIFN